MNREKGYIFGELVMGILFVAFLAYAFWLAPLQSARAFDELRVAPRMLTADEQLVVETHKSLPEPVIKPSGHYFGRTSIGGTEFALSYYFGDNNTVTKEVVVKDRHTMSGSALYQFQGSALSFTDVKGDQYLFPEAGEAITFVSQNVWMTHEGDVTVILKASGQARPVPSDDAATTIEDVDVSGSNEVSETDGIIEKHYQNVVSRLNLKNVIMLTALFVPIAIILAMRRRRYNG